MWPLMRWRQVTSGCRGSCTLTSSRSAARCAPSPGRSQLLSACCFLSNLLTVAAVQFIWPCSSSAEHAIPAHCIACTSSPALSFYADMSFASRAGGAHVLGGAVVARQSGVQYPPRSSEARLLPGAESVDGAPNQAQEPDADTSLCILGRNYHNAASCRPCSCGTSRVSNKHLFCTALCCQLPHRITNASLDRLKVSVRPGYDAS